MFIVTVVALFSKTSPKSAEPGSSGQRNGDRVLGDTSGAHVLEVEPAVLHLLKRETSPPLTPTNNRNLERFMSGPVDSHEIVEAPRDLMMRSASL